MTSPTGAERESRLAFAIPVIKEPPEGIDPALLNRADPDDRMLLIGAAHPDLQAAIDSGEETVVSGDLKYSPRLHLTMHELVAAQIIDDDPPEVWRTAQRLRELGYGQHEILHMLASTMELGKGKTPQVRGFCFSRTCASASASKRERSGSSGAWEKRAGNAGSSPRSRLRSPAQPVAAPPHRRAHSLHARLRSTPSR